MTYRCVTIWQLNDNFRPIFQIVKVGRKNSINKSTEFRNFKIHSIATKFQLQIRNETAPRSYLKSNNAIIDKQGNEKEYRRPRTEKTVVYTMRGYPIFVHQLSILLKAVPKRGKSVSKRASSSPERAKENKDVAPFFPLFSPSLSFSFPPLLSVQALLIPRHNTGTWFRSVRFERMPRRPRVHRDTKSFLFDNEESAYPPQWPPGKRFSTVPLKRTKPPP